MLVYINIIIVCNLGLTVNVCQAEPEPESHESQSLFKCQLIFYLFQPHAEGLPEYC